jgi:hypothetical protein
MNVAAVIIAVASVAVTAALVMAVFVWAAKRETARRTAHCRTCSSLARGSREPARTLAWASVLSPDRARQRPARPT